MKSFQTLSEYDNIILIRFKALTLRSDHELHLLIKLINN
jgi:hypothetical protein